MTPADVQAVAAVEVTAYGHPWSTGNFSDSIGHGHLCELLEEQRHGQSHLAGYWVGLSVLDEMHVLNLTVSPPYQGRGLGHVLLDRLEYQARLGGIRSLWLEVRASNVKAQRLYGSRGFVTASTRKGYYPLSGVRREDAWVMCRFLDNGGAA